jgi:acyl-CoA dehydrogenase
MGFLGEVAAFCAENGEDETLKPLVTSLQKSLEHCQAAAMWFMQNAMGRPDNAGAGATDFMHLLGLLAMGYMWGRMAKAALARKAAGNGEAARMDAKLTTARFFAERMLPETGLLYRRIQSGADPVMAMPAEMF